MPQCDPPISSRTAALVPAFSPTASCRLPLRLSRARGAVLCCFGPVREAERPRLRHERSAPDKKWLAQSHKETDGSSRSSDLSRKQRRQGKWGGWCSLVAVPITRALPPPRSPTEPPDTSPSPPAQNHSPHANDAEDARRAAISARTCSSKAYEGRACGHAGRRRLRG